MSEITAAQLDSTARTTGAAVAVNLRLPAVAGSAAAQPLAIEPGDSPAVVSAKVRAFTLNILLEVLDALPVSTKVAAQLGEIASAAFKSARAARELAVGLSATDSLRSHSTDAGVLSPRLVGDGSLPTVTASQPHRLEAQVLKSGEIFRSPALFDLRRLAATLAEAREVSTAFSPASLSGVSFSAPARVLRDVTAAVDIKVSGMLTAVLNGDPAGSAVLRAELRAILTEGINKILQTARDLPASAASAPRFTASEWRLITAMQSLVNESAFGATLGNEIANATSPAASDGSATSKNFRTFGSLPKPEQLRAAIEARDVFFSALPSDKSGGDSYGRATLEQELTRIISALHGQSPLWGLSSAQTLASSQPLAINHAALSGLLSALAARLVSAHRLHAPLIEESGRARSRYRRAEQPRSERAWILDFSEDAASEEGCHSVRVSIDQRAASRVRVDIRADVRAQSDMAASARIATRGQILSAAFGFNWFDWGVTEL